MTTPSKQKIDGDEDLDIDDEFQACQEVISFSTESSSPDKSCSSREEEEKSDGENCSDMGRSSCTTPQIVATDQGTVSRRESLQRLSRDFSKDLLRRRSSVKECLPETPVGWTVLLASLASAGLGYEIRLQRSLTCPPLVFGQCQDGPLKQIHSRLTQSKRSILARTIQPSLFVGTRGALASAVAYSRGGPASHGTSRLFREMLTTSQDGATIAIDWELPLDLYSSSVTARRTAAERKQQVLNGPIDTPVVLILHGINNDSSFGYMRSLMRTCTDRGWVACGMNFRGCGGVPLTTPRAYTGAYTGDMRHVVRTISSRLAKDVPMFLVGHSLGANLIVKYLGEEGLSGSLPECVAAGVSLGNPLKLDAREMRTPWAQLLSLGTRKDLLKHFRSLRKMKSSHFQQRIWQALRANRIDEFDEALSQIFIRNEDVYPFNVKIGYNNAAEYWEDGSSCRVVQHVSVPLLSVVSQDDFLVYGPSFRKLSFCLENPNVMVVNTRCGGHLGWQESPPDADNIFGFGTSWANTATADFLDAVLSALPYRNQHKPSDIDREKDHEPRTKNFRSKSDNVSPPMIRSKL